MNSEETTALNNVGIRVRDPSKLTNDGMTTANSVFNELYYFQRTSSLIRPYYLQIGRKGLLHKYNGSHVLDLLMVYF